MYNEQKNHSPRLENALEFIDSNFRNEISVVDIANTVNMSRFHFIREFKRTVGVTPGQYLIKARIKYSQRLLLRTNMTVKKITNAAGYKDAVQFARLFKASVGVTPSAYRGLHGADLKQVCDS